MKSPGIKKNVLYAIFIICFVFAYNLFGQDLKFGQISVKDGLSNSFVNCLLQDQQGFIWCGTDDGLNRYDGYEIKIFRNNPGDSTSLSDNIIWSLYEDQDGFLWVGTGGGILNRYDPFNDKFDHWALKSEDAAEKGITYIYEDSKHCLWVGTYRSGLYRLDQSKKYFNHWQSDISNPNILSSNFITSVLEDDNSTIWIATYAGLSKFAPDTPDNPFRKVSLIKNTGGDGTELPIWYLSKSSFYDGSIWIGKLDGLIKFDVSSESATQIQLSKNISLPFSNSVSSVVEEISNNEKILLVGTYGGLVQQNLTSGSSDRILYAQKSSSGLLSNQINDLIIDKSGVAWIGTDNGLNNYSPKRAKFNFQLSRVRFSKEIQKISNENVRAISYSKDGALWIGAERGLYGIIYDDANSKIIQNAEMQTLNTWALCYGSSNNLWIGTYGQGLKELNLKTGKVKTWKVGNPDFNLSAFQYVKTILSDDKGMLWVGFWGGGLARMNLQNGNIQYWHHINDRPNSLSYNDVWIVYQDTKGRIWIGTNGGGLDLFSEEQSGFYHWKAVEKNKHTLSSNNIFTIYESTNRNISEEKTVLWIGTANGLNKFVINNDLEKNTSLSVAISSFTVDDGLPDNTIESILEDDDGNLWIGTSAGISFFNVKKEIFTNYTLADGLTGSSFNSTASVKTKEGLMIFGCTTGLNYFYPERVTQSIYIPPVVITDFQLFNQQNSSNNFFGFKKNLFGAGQINLSYSQNDFSFQFASLDYNAPENNQYAYKLEGFDKDWIYSGTRRFVTYTNLDPGEYLFRVKATNSDGLWNETGTSVSMIINPPFWETWWAYSIYVVLFFSSLGMIRAAEIKRRKKKEEERLRREREAALLREAKLKAITIEQEKELEKQKIRNRIAQDLHDEIGSNLSSISLMSELIQKDGKINTEAFEKIQRIQKVAKGSSQAMRDIVWLTNPSSDNIKDLASKMNEVANNMLGGLDWQFDFPQNLSEINLVPEVKRNLFFIYKESLNNILKHSGAKNVKIKLGIDDQLISLAIKDDGKGFNNAQGFPGNGLRNLRNRANEINGLLTINSGPGNGTSLNLEVNIT